MEKNQNTTTTPCHADAIAREIGVKRAFDTGRSSAASANGDLPPSLLSLDSNEKVEDTEKAHTLKVSHCQDSIQKNTLY